MSKMILKNFFNTEEMEKIKAKKNNDLENEKRQYFSELEMLISMMMEKKLIEAEQFFLLYDDICDNLNRVTAVEMES